MLTSLPPGDVLFTPLNKRRPASLYVVGIDTSSARLAVSLPKQKTFVFDADGDADERRIALFRAARTFFKSLPPRTLAVCEEPLSLKNGKTSRLLGLAAGAIWSAHLECDIFWLWADVSHWKKETVGSGSATKAQIRTWVEEQSAFQREDLEAFLRTPDLWDAWAIRDFGEQYASKAAISERA